MSFKTLQLALIPVLGFAFLTGFGVKKSSVKPTVKVVGDKVEVEFLVQPDAGIDVTPEGPWSVAFTQAPGLKFELIDGKYVSNTYDSKLPGIKASAAIDGKATSGKVDYEVRAFVCTSDKKQCFPQQHKGSFDWKKS